MIPSTFPLRAWASRSQASLTPCPGPLPLPRAHLLGMQRQGAGALPPKAHSPVCCLNRGGSPQGTQLERPKEGHHSVS